MTTVQDIYRFIDQVAPFAIQESWDNAGMLVGHWKRPVQKIHARSGVRGREGGR